MSEARETSGLTTSLLIGYVRAQGGDDAVADVLHRAGATPLAEQLEDEHSWTSFACKVSLLEAAAEVLGQPDVGFRIGESVLETQLGNALKFGLRLFGSPSGLVRSVARAGARFSTAARTEAVQVQRTRAVVRYQLAAGHTPARVDCDYTRGLLTRVPVLFGLSPAVVHHSECQVDGAAACVYELTWSRYHRLGLRRHRGRPAEVRVGDAALSQIRVLQDSVADLVTEQDLDRMLDRIATRARTTVHAPAHLLAVRWPGAEKWILRADGVLDADRLLPAIERAAPDGPAQLVVDGRLLLLAPLRSVRHHFGWLIAALPGDASEAALSAEIASFATFAALAASAMEGHLAYAQALRRERMTHALLGLARRLLRCDTAPAVLSEVLAAGLEISGADTSSLFLWDAADGCLRLAESAGWRPDQRAALQNVVLRMEDTPELARRLASPDECVVYHAAELQHDPVMSMLWTSFGLASSAVVPLHRDGALTGLMLVNWVAEGRAGKVDVSADTLAALTGLADQATTALDKARLHQQVCEQARTDQLTGLANRRTFMQALEEQVAGAGGGAMIFLDLDAFKGVNDELGHAAGDALLIEVADRLRAAIRDGDVVARLGGDEFTILLRGGTGPGADLDGVTARITEQLARPMKLGDRIVPLRASVGGVWLRGDDAESVLGQADAAMYLAKRAGGNTVAILPRQAG